MSRATDQLAEELPLRYTTPPEWATHALADPLALLCDHAHLEKKAATNALDLLTRWPEREPPEHWLRVVTAVARDEIEHLAIVIRLIHKRGGRMDKMHRNAYASQLRSLVRYGRGPQELVDRLMVSALIEARSCERFALLGRACPDPELAKLYNGLYASEAGHYRTFLELVERVPGARSAEARWNEILDAEAEIIQRMPPGPAMHSGLPGGANG